MAPNKLAQNKASSLMSLIKYCIKYGIDLKITGESITCSLPCGVDESVSFNSFDNEDSDQVMTSKVYGLLCKVEKQIRELAN